MDGKPKKLSGCARRKLNDERAAKQNELLKKIQPLTSFFKQATNTSSSSDVINIQAEHQQQEHQHQLHQETLQEEIQQDLHVNVLPDSEKNMVSDVVDYKDPA